MTTYDSNERTQKKHKSPTSTPDLTTPEVATIAGPSQSGAFSRAPYHLTSERILHLQRTVGNRAVGRLLADRERQSHQPQSRQPQRRGTSTDKDAPRVQRTIDAQANPAPNAVQRTGDSTLIQRDPDPPGNQSTSSNSSPSNSSGPDLTTGRDLIQSDVQVVRDQLIPWLEQEASKDGMSTLAGVLAERPIFGSNAHKDTDDQIKRSLLRQHVLGWGGKSLKPFTLQNLKNGLSARKFTSGFRKKVEWQKVSALVMMLLKTRRQVKGFAAQLDKEDVGDNIWKYREKWDYTTISSGLLSGSSGFVGGSIRTGANLFGGGMGSGLAAGLGATSAGGYGLGLIGSSAAAIGHGIEGSDKNLSMSERAIEYGQMGTSLLDVGWQGSGVGYYAGKAGAAVSQGAAMGAAGVLGVGAGAAYLGVGTYKALDSGIKAHKLGKIEESYGDKNAKYENQDVVGRSAGFGKKSQQAATVAHTAAAIMGGTMIAAGVLLLASNPIGWTIMAVAGGIGAAGAIYRYFKWRGRKKKLTDKLLGIDRDELKGTAREAERKKRLQKLGFISIDQFYQSHLWLMAGSLYERAMGDPPDPKAQGVIKNIGVKFDPDMPREKQIQKIAQKLEY